MRFVRWVTDYRNGATVVASVLVALVGFVVIDARDARQEAERSQAAALEARSDTAAAARRRIDLLQERIALLEDRGQANSAEIGQLKAEIAALQEQIEREGGDPVVPRTTTTTRPASTTTSTTSTSTTSTTEPPDDCRVEVAGICIP